MRRVGGNAYPQFILAYKCTLKFFYATMTLCILQAG